MAPATQPSHALAPRPSGNTGDRGGGLYAKNVTSLLVTRCTFEVGSCIAPRRWQ